MKTPSSASIPCLVLLAAAAGAQPIAFDAEHLDLQGKATFVEFQSRPCLRVEAGAAIVKEVEFQDGDIEFDALTTGTGAGFFGMQMFSERRHANDGTDDLTFWAATRKSVPRSAKAHLNYSVMQGARGDLQARVDANQTAFELAPQWPMNS